MVAQLIVGAAVPSLLICWACGFYVRRRAAGWGLIDQPGERKVHSTPTPLGGGLAVWLGVVVTFALGQIALWTLAWMIQRTGADGRAATLPLGPLVATHLDGLVQQSGKLWILLGAGTVLMLLGLADDRRGVDWRIRLAVQGLVAAVVVWWQDWRLTVFIDQPLVTGLFSVLWIVALVNAFNMLDNMDGLSAGVASIAAVMLAAVLLMAPDPDGQGPQLFVAGFLLVLAGALVGFLWHNRPPARLFLGDAGSYFIGFSIAIATLLATFAGQQGQSRHAILAPLCVMAVPLYDLASVLWIRLRVGRSPFQADKSHFSHRLVELGLTKTQAVLTIYLTTATCGLGALLLHQVNRLGAAIIVLLVVCVLALIAILESTARRTIGSK